MIYVPELNNENCVIIYSSEIIRVYETTPTTNSSVNYKDYYPKLNYSYNTGTQQFNQYSNIPTCREATTDIMKNPNINTQVGIATITLLLGILIIYNFLKDLYDNKR